MRRPDEIQTSCAGGRAALSCALPLVTGVLFLLASVPARLSAQSGSDCISCHGEASLSVERNGRTVSLYVDAEKFAGSAHGSLECVACHEGLRSEEVPHARRIKRIDCLSCHSEEQFISYANSVHGATKSDNRPVASCSDCHSSHEIQYISDKGSGERKEFAAQICSRCHDDVTAKYRESDHGLALTSGTKGAPTCIDCHDEHVVVSPSTEGAPTSRRKEAATCLHCHLDNAEVRARVGPSAGFVSSYERSVHGQAVERGNDVAAVCTDCHGSHEMRKGSNPSSKVSKQNIAATCGQCHSEIKAQYDGSIHGEALKAGIDASATCTDCHGEHNILSPKDDRSPVAAKNVSAQVCSPCHASVKLTEKFGLASDRFRSFEDSFHGLAGRAGSVEVANCASCHGVHDIKPSSDPTSRIHRDNLVATCGACHPGANVNFTKGAVHVVATAGEDEVLYLVSTGYIVLIVVLVGGMFLHNVLDFVKKSKQQLMYRRGIVQRRPSGHGLYLRMSLSERIQHGILLVSFAVLVLTGFALKFPDAWWVAPLQGISPIMFDIRGVVHRIAGVVMVLAGIYHIYYVSFVPRGKQLLRDLLPVREDVKDMIGVLKYNLGLSDVKPAFGRFGYVEKAEYWALVWGTIVMAVTGTILWFDNTFLGLITKLWWDVANTVHYYEAWLATLAILVWHLYFVILNPDVYPMNLAWWKGTLTEEEMEHEHALELEEIRRKEIMEGLETNVSGEYEEREEAVRVQNNDGDESAGLDVRQDG